MVCFLNLLRGYKPLTLENSVFYFLFFFLTEKSLFVCLYYLNLLNGIQMLSNTELSWSVLTVDFLKVCFLQY